jgi:hypothetical protein
MATILDGTSGTDIFGMGGGQGGILSGLILGALLGNRGGLFGNNAGVVADSRPVTVADLNATALGDIKASIPFNEGQVQLAISNAVAALMANSNQNANTIHTGQTAAALAAATDTALITRDIGAVDTNVDRQSTAIQMAIKEDGQATRALITANQIADLNQRLTVAQLESSELRANNARDRDRHDIEITMTNNQNQNQLQFQEQRQTQNQLVGLLASLAQNINATNQAINIGSGGQIANPANTNTNVRA